MNKKITEARRNVFDLYTSRTEDSVPKCQNPTTISVPRIHISRYNDYIILNNATDSLHRRGIILNLKYHSVCPLVRIGSSHLLSRKRASVTLPPPEPRGGDNTRLRERGWADPIRTTGEKAWHFVYSVPCTVKCIYLRHNTVILQL